MLQYGCGQSFELHIEGQRGCDQAENRIGGEGEPWQKQHRQGLEVSQLVESLGPSTRESGAQRQDMKLGRLARICSEPLKSQDWDLHAQLQTTGVRLREFTSHLHRLPVSDLSKVT